MLMGVALFHLSTRADTSTEYSIAGFLFSASIHQAIETLGLSKVIEDMNQSAADNFTFFWLVALKTVVRAKIFGFRVLCLGCPSISAL